MTPPLAHRWTGEGPDVVLVNGGMMTFAAWEPVAAALDPRYRVLRFDFRGQLLSPGDPPTEVAGHVDDMERLLDALGVDRAHFVGTSFGAIAAVAFAARRPERTASLLLATAMDRETERFRTDAATMRRVLAGILAGGERGEFYDRLVGSVYSKAWRVREAATLALRRGQTGLLPLAWYEAVDRLLGAIEGFDLTPDLAVIAAHGIPSRVLVAAEDEIMDRDRAEALAAALGAEIRTHPTAGHGLVVEDPAWLAAETLDFLDRVVAA